MAPRCIIVGDDTLVRFTRASVAGLDWLLDPANQAEAVALYRKHLPDVPEAAAVAAVKAITGTRDSFSKGGRFDMPGVENVLKLRSEFERPQKNLTDPSRYLDETYLRAATAPR